ncbi:hypothetical protein PHISP_02952 [Aspergillus sp. HF37]|nr:hypothetical protein PHISP_02952 [Aspergillus sp. HF37]
MQKTSVPEGTVFIAVGVVLGVIGLSVLAWRALVAWSVNRSVRRAALMHQRHHHRRGSSESKGLLRSKHRRRKRSSSSRGLSLEKMSKDSGRRGSRGDRGGGGGGGVRAAPTVPAVPAIPTTTSASAAKIPTSSSGLFFSPTAVRAGLHGSSSAAAGAGTGGNRSSGYLPAGYYAAAGSVAGGSTTNITNTTTTPGHSAAYLPTSISGLGPQAHGYTRTRSSGPSPPGSPVSPFVHDPSRHSLAGASTSTLNLASQASQVRAPSTYLEDLFESHAAPPPPAGSSSEWSHRS